jgi:hypothetical protein
LHLQDTSLKAQNCLAPPTMHAEIAIRSGTEILQNPYIIIWVDAVRDVLHAKINQTQIICKMENGGMLTTAEIRKIVYDRQEHKCLWCFAPLTWEMAHLHEKTPRGKGGKISLDNSIILCYNCHMFNKGAHGKRHPQWRKDA